MHENQLTYPLSPHEEFDFHFGFTNIISCLAADRVVFNSDLPPRPVPGRPARPTWAGCPRPCRARCADRLAAAARCCRWGWTGRRCPPTTFPALPRAAPCRSGRRAGLAARRAAADPLEPPLGIRQAARSVRRRRARLLDRGAWTSTWPCWARPRSHDEVFAPLARAAGRPLPGLRLPGGPRRLRRGWLARGDIVVSCAEQEYFGISVAEAIHAGCYPVLPREQVYPCLYGGFCKGRHFYDDDDQLVSLLADLVAGDGAGHVCSLAGDVDAFCWPRLAPRLRRSPGRGRRRPAEKATS